jgi:hypothetical protein
MPTPRLKLLIPSLVCAAFAAAAEPVIPALHLSLAEASGDFREEMGSKLGLGAAMSLTVPLTRTFALRPTVAYQSFPTLNNQYAYKSTRYSDRGEEETRWSAWSYGADGLFRPGGPEGSLYFLLGGYLKIWRLHGFGTYTTQDSLNATRTYTVNDTSTKNEPALTLGLGWTLGRHVSVEGRTVVASYRSLSYNTVELSLVLSY